MKDKIGLLLDETRVILPGTQAILGFQLVAVFSQGFDRLDNVLKIIHLICVIFILISVILLMSTAGYHRIAQKSSENKKVLSYGSKMLILSMLFFLTGMCGDIFIVSYYITNSNMIAFIFGAIVLILALFMWYIFPMFKRRV